MFTANYSKTADNFYKLKRKIYLVIIPLIVISMMSYWFFSPYVDSFTVVALPHMAIFLIFFLAAVIKNVYVRTLELVSLGLFTLYHFVRVAMLIANLETNGFNLYFLWSPLFFIFIFVIIKGKKGLVYSLFVYVVTVLLGIPELDHPRQIDTLYQFYLASLAYIVVLYCAQIIVSSYFYYETLKEMAFQDSLTKTYNRRMLDFCILDGIKSAEQRNTTFSIIYFDIDHFKKINDEYGHEVGDNVLKEVSEIVKNNIRESDHFGRWAGEEFLIVVANDTIDQATQLAERLRMKIQHHSFVEGVQITASFGVSCFQESDQPRTILWRADLALYQAKNTGRNKVQHA